ncbi:MAG: murein biosynthesis integral membrane protein MurJ [Elusimicrobia bacterium]|nr:murein biosynthesis integral membrane protein MurJ [Elusimicrobiota bacterium]MBI3013345.1 murein biosynthesis integral membrane protein MurJ [Elusimicrobiota bacterium]
MINQQGSQPSNAHPFSSHLFSKWFGKFSSATLLSRILGYFRDASVAYLFGGGAITDSFYTAFRISNLFRRLLGEGSFASSFIPVFTKSLKEKPREESQKFIDATFTSLLFVLILITAIGILFAPILTNLIAPGFSAEPQKFHMTVLLTRWTFPFFLFISLAALVSSILNALKHFFLPAVAPAALSVAEIGYIFMALPVLLHFLPNLTIEMQIVGLSIAVVAGGAIHLLVQIPTLWKEKLKLQWRWNWNHPELVQVRHLMLPAILGLSVDQINAFVNTICATFLVEGSVTALYNSNRLMQFPLALFGIAIASISLPIFSDYSAEKNYQKLGETINGALRTVLFIVAPASIGLTVLANPIISLLFQHGKFTSFASDLTTQALWGYNIGLLAYSAVKILANGFYALQDSKVPAKVACFCILLNVGLSLFLMGPLGVGGLALATALSSWANALILFILMRRRLLQLGLKPLERIGEHRLGQTAAKTLIASGILLLYLWALSYLKPFLNLFGIISLGVLGGAVLYLLFAKFLKMDEYQVLIQSHLSRNGSIAIEDPQ